MGINFMKLASSVVLVILNSIVNTWITKDTEAGLQLMMS